MAYLKPILMGRLYIQVPCAIFRDRRELDENPKPTAIPRPQQIQDNYFSFHET